MKKKNVVLGKKIFLHKNTIANLNASKVVGGGTTPPSRCQSCNTLCEVPLPQTKKCLTEPLVCEPIGQTAPGMYC